MLQLVGQVDRDVLHGEVRVIFSVHNLSWLSDRMKLTQIENKWDEIDTKKTFRTKLKLE